ncbi:MAG TPA: DinB family protein [Candidatus Limnocylindria bacterium]
MSTIIELLKAKRRQTGERLLKVVDDLSDLQLGWRPAPRAHSIGFTLWHAARADDNVQADLSERALEWVTGGYAKRWGHPERGVGTGWEDERSAALTLPPKAELLEYAGRVFHAVDAAVSALDEVRLGEVVPSRFMSEPSTRAEVLLVSLSHDNRHLGEMEYIKGLLGLTGTVTT